MVSSTVIAIVGPTASGKSSLGMALAKQYHGEIIAADSRTVYRRMDIGTAKPSAADRQAVPHHLLDLVEPGQPYSAAQFKDEAEGTVTEVAERGHVPIVVGGTGLYVYSLLYDYRFPAGPPNQLRNELQALPLPILVERLQNEDPQAAAMIDLRNPRRVIRALETVGQPRQAAVRLKSNFLLLGLRPSADQLNKQIAQRTHAMFQIGLIDEVRHLVEDYGPYNEAFRSPGYAEIIDFLAERIDQEEAERLINLHTRQLVKRQLTWFKRNPEILWCATPEAAKREVARFLE